MYDEVKKIIEFIAEHNYVKFAPMIKKLNLDLSTTDQEKVKRFLINENIIEPYVEDGGTFGLDDDYILTNDGHALLDQIREVETLDRILAFLYSYENPSYLSLEEISKRLNIVPSKILFLKLERSGCFAIASDKSGKSYRLSDEGYWYLSNGGFTQQVVDRIDRKLTELKTTDAMKARQVPPEIKSAPLQNSLREYQADIDKYFPEKPVSNVVNIHAHNYFHNQDNTVDKQAGTINEAARESHKRGGNIKPFWLRVLYYLFLISMVGGTLYLFLKLNFL